MSEQTQQAGDARAVEREFQLAREELAHLIAVCPAHGRAADCPILMALTDEDVT